MDSWYDRRMLEAILCTLLAQTGGCVRLSVPEIAAHSGGFRICPEADWDGQTLTLTLEALPSQESHLYVGLNGVNPECN